VEENLHTGIIETYISVSIYLKKKNQTGQWNSEGANHY